MEQDIPEPDIVFTRYLYIKQEVKLALLACLLNKKDDALFWAYELYYSGFVYELCETIFKFYYDFYAMLNEGFETYLLKKTKDMLKNYNSANRDDKIVGSIIKNFLIRPFNTDVFMLQNICKLFEVDCEINKNSPLEDIIAMWIENNDYLKISQFILNEIDNYYVDLEEFYSIVLDIFSKEDGLQVNKSKQTNNFTRSKIVNINPKQVLLAKIIELFARKHNFIMGKNKYAIFDISETILYETLDHCKDGIKNYRILQSACKLGVNDEKHLGLFHIGRHKLPYNTLQSIYNGLWEYYASWCPFWDERIKSCHGKYDHITKTVIFDDDDLFDTFHDNYDYEPDEQPLFVKNKSIMPVDDSVPWNKFYEKYKNQSLFNADIVLFINELYSDKIYYIK